MSNRTPLGGGKVLFAIGLLGIVGVWAYSLSAQNDQHGRGILICG